MYCRPGALTGRLFNRPPAHVFPERLLLNSILRHPHDSCKSAPCRGSTSNPGRSHFVLFAPSPPRTGRGQGRGVDLVRPRGIPSPPRLPFSASDGEKVAEGQMRCPGRVAREPGWANHCYRPPLHQPEARRRRRRRNTDPAPNTDRINCFLMKLTKVHVREFKSIRDSMPLYPRHANLEKPLRPGRQNPLLRSDDADSPAHDENIKQGRTAAAPVAPTATGLVRT